MIWDLLATKEMTPVLPLPMPAMMMRDMLLMIFLVVLAAVMLMLVGLILV